MRNMERSAVLNKLKKEADNNGVSGNLPQKRSRIGYKSGIVTVDGIGIVGTHRRGRIGGNVFIAVLLCLIMLVVPILSLHGCVNRALAAPVDPDTYAGDYAGLEAAVAAAPGGAEYVIEITNDFDFPSDKTAISIPAGKNITLVSGGDFTLTVRGVFRHFNINGTFTLTDGITLTRNASDGGGVVVMGNGTFNMAGGAISGNSSVVKWNGGGVEVNKNGTFNMTGGTISNNSADKTWNGGGVYVFEGQFTMEGGTISGNNAFRDGGGVYAGPASTFVFKGGTISDNTAQYGGGVYILSASEGPSKFDMYDGAVITRNKAVEGNMFNHYGGGVYLVTNSEFNMYGGTISANTAQIGGGVCVQSNSETFTMYGGKISGNEASWSGGGVATLLGAFHMKDGLISGNTALSGNWSGGGGGVFVEDSSFIMDKGTISGNTSNMYGGGVLANTGTHLIGNFTMNGGTIGDNLAGYGGGVALNGLNNVKNSVFKMNNGNIVSNEASGGGGVFLMNGVFTMKNGVIDSNTATGTYGGGAVMIWDLNVDRFIMEGGTISNNSAPNGDGGGVWTYNPENQGVDTLKIFAQSVFFGNSASRAFNRDLMTNSPLPSVEWVGMNEAGRGNSIYGTHLLNNYDVYYVWGPQVMFFTVTFVDWDAEVLKTQKVPSGGDAAAPVNPTRDGWVFKGWDKGYTNVTEDITVTALYEKIPDQIINSRVYTVTFVDWNKHVLKTQEVMAGGDATAPVVPNRNGWTFQDWDREFTNVTEDITVTALYRRDTVPSDPSDPTDPTEPPVDPTNQPVDPTEPPVDPTEPPVDPTNPPVDLTKPPVNPTDPPSGTQNERPPVPERPHLVPDGDDHYIEFDDDDTPTGEWYWDDGGGTWVYVEYPPVSGMPQTLIDDWISFYLVMLCISVACVVFCAISIRRFKH